MRTLKWVFRDLQLTSEQWHYLLMIIKPSTRQNLVMSEHKILDSMHLITVDLSKRPVGQSRFWLIKCDITCNSDTVVCTNFPRFMMTSSNGNIFRVTDPLCGKLTGPGEFPTQRPVTRSFDVFFDLRRNKRSSKPTMRLVIWDSIVVIMTSL